MMCEAIQRLTPLCRALEKDMNSEGLKTVSYTSARTNLDD